ncbi:MAG: c-type cytochrome [Azoarcus sp.]|jgi:cytochrome c553|nr:c-type cytochrome [Azoarcus sp.]
MIKRTLLLSLLLATGIVKAQDQAAATAEVQNPAAVEKWAPPALCVTCHGDNGNNWVKKEDGTFGKTDGGADSPKLAGQHSDYLMKQFSEFKNGTRANAIMVGMIPALPESDYQKAAEFYAAQPIVSAAAQNKPDSDAFALGQKIWRAGLASKGLPACAACHGPAGKGMSAQYPALAGQFPEYIEAQLKTFRDGARANDPSKMMRDIALKMTDPEIKAVSDYSAGLR